MYDDEKRTEREREFEIIQKVGHVAYKLKFSPSAKIHHVFHISQLKKKVRPQTMPSIDPPICSLEGKPLVDHVAILDRRKKGNKYTTQVYQWANLLPEEATWEDYNFIKSQFPDFDEP
ncbi:uncharacterized protein [Nicotiana tomentosiformis]|uniref:uncharacterized protein n=1 Tax=Nicotiana tomentosiformis TaxID=4098 RepID=UPI00388C4520